METNIDDIVHDSRAIMFEKRKGTRINLWRTTDDDTEWIDALYGKLFSPFGRRNVKRENSCRMVLVNLAILKGSPMIAPFHRSYYSSVPSDMSARGITDTLHALEDAGYLRVDRGYHVEDTTAPTVVEPTDTLKASFPDKLKSTIREPGLIRCDEFQVPEGPVLNVHGQLREDALRRYNAFMMEEPQFQLYAICKKGYEEYGRFHGSVLQHIPKEQRSRLILDNEPTFEIDIKSCLPFIALAMKKGVGYKSDIYRVPGLPRSVMKKAVILGLNNPSKKKAVAAFQGWLNRECRGVLPDGSPASAPELYSSLEEDHPVLRELMYKNSGLYLMNIESMHMAMFFSQMTFLRIPVFPIHDAVIARVSDMEIVKERFIDTFTINDVQPQVTITRNEVRPPRHPSKNGDVSGSL